VSAVRTLQEQHGLPVTGTVDKATEEALRSDLAEQGADAEQQAVASTAAVQQTLKLAGWWTGPVDGEWTPELTDALKAAQTELGVAPTGTVDAATVAALQRTLSAAGTPPDPEGSTTPSPSSTETEPTEPARSPSGTSS